MSGDALAALDEGLQSFRDGLAATPEWDERHQMTAALALIRAHHRGEARSVARERIMAAVEDYLLSGEVSSQEELFHLCLGAGWLDVDGKGILAERELRRNLFALAETVTGRAKRLRTFRHLLYAYWSFPLHAAATPQAAIEGWQELRTWLKERHAAFSRHPARKPGWFNALAPHLHLLEEHPCAPYAAALLRGNFDQLQRAIDALRIPTDAWLKVEAVLAQIDAAAHWPDEAFREALADLLKLATGDGGIEVPGGLTQRAIARLVARYARQKNDEAHEGLFLLALEKIGNPWRQRAAWDALVRDEGGNPCSLSREMVNVWLKDRLIGAFFGDGGQAQARSGLWQRYSVFIQEISLASPWREAPGQALVLRMGDFLVIVPKHRDQPIEAFPWQAFVSGGGARLLDRDKVDGGAIQQILAPHVAALRAHQTLEEAHKFFEFILSTKTRWQSLSRL